MHPDDEYPPSSGGPGGERAAARAVPVRSADVARVRVPLVMLTTFLVELVVVAAVGNQFVVDRLSKQLHGPILKQGLLESLFTFYWRFSPTGGVDEGHFWLSRVLCAAAVVVLGPLLVALVVRGPITLFRAFFSVLFAVVVATLLATFVRGLVADPRLYGFKDPQLGAAMFRPSGPDAPAFWGGLALGLVTALIVAIVAVRTRRAPAFAVGGNDDRDDREDRYSDDRYSDDRYRDDLHGADRYGEDRYSDGAYRDDPYRDDLAPAVDRSADRTVEYLHPRGGVPFAADRQGSGPDGRPPWQDRSFGPPAPTGIPRPAEQGPVQQSPVQQSPVQQGPVQQSPVQQSPVQQGAVQQGAAEWRPHQDASTEQWSRQDRPASQWAGQGSPGQDAPTQALRVPDADLPDRTKGDAPVGPVAPRREQPRPPRSAMPDDTPDVRSITTLPPALPGTDQSTTRFPRPPDDEDFDPEH